MPKGAKFILFTFLSLLTLIMIAARIWALEKNPPGLANDEVSFGYNAYSILKTGKDEYGNPFPLAFRAFGEYKNPTPVYFLVPFVAIFGPTPLALRLPFALVSLLNIFLLALLLRKFLSRPFLILTAAFLFVISPWAFFYSRFVYEGNLALFFLLLGLVFFFSKTSLVNLSLSSIFLALSVYSHHNTKIVIPLLFIFLFFKKLKGANLAQKATFLIIFVTILTPLLPSALSKSGVFTRGAMTSLLTDQNIRQQVLNDIHNYPPGTLPLPLIRFVHNKFAYFAKPFLDNYTYLLGPQFLVFKSDPNSWFNFPNVGLLGWWQYLFFLLGAFLIIKRERALLFFVFWFLAALIPAALALNFPDAASNRGFLAVVPVQVIAAFGLTSFWQMIKSRLSPGKIWLGLAAVLVLLSWETLSTLLNYHFTFKKNALYEWRAGALPTARYLEQNKNQYDKIFVGTDVLLAEHYLFSNRYPPQKLFSQGLETEVNEWGFSHLKKVENIEFTNPRKEFDSTKLGARNALIWWAETPPAGKLSVNAKFASSQNLPLKIQKELFRNPKTGHSVFVLTPL